MSALQLTITQAGRNALVNAQNTGTLPLTIDQVVLGAGLYLPDEGQTALHSPIKTLTTFGGQVVADDTIHLTITDDSADGYTLGEIGLYAGSVLMAVYAQETAILEKGTSQLVLLSADIQFTSLPANAITVGDTEFAYPQATESAKGVLEIATPTEAATGTDHSTAITPKTLKQETDKKLGKTETAVAAGKWATARTLSLAGDASGSVSFDGSANMTLTVSVADNSHLHTISNISGLQTALDAKLAATANAVSASKWATSRTISLTGDASGSVSLDGSANVTLAVTVADDSHNHVIGNVDGLQSALDGKLDLTGGTLSGGIVVAAGSGNMGIRVGSATHKAGVAASSVAGEYLFGGASDGGTVLTSYIRVGETQLTYAPNTSSQYNIYHTGYKPTAADVGALPATANAVSASKWATARTLTLTGDAAGSVSLDGSANVTLTVAVADDSHSHTIANVDGLQAALDGKLAATANAVSASKWATARILTLTGDITGSVSLDGSGNVSLATSLAVSSGDKGAAATTLWTGSFGTHPTTLPLASAIANFKKVRFSGVNSDNTIAWSVTLSYDEWAALCATGLAVYIASGTYAYRFINPPLSATTLTRDTSVNCYLTKIVGLN
ncbi:MAG: hypothetical protein LRY38_08235 [Aeromonadaceae bacterium]|nr:hypothetical protein [Aeromonadaceae bacterium]